MKPTDSINTQNTFSSENVNFLVLTLNSIIMCNAYCYTKKMIPFSQKNLYRVMRPHVSLYTPEKLLFVRAKLKLRESVSFNLMFPRRTYINFTGNIC